MKNQQREQAQDLYFQANLTKTEIAAKLGVNRRTVMLWSQQGNWDKLRQSSRHMPALIAEKCYYLLDQYMTHLLTDGAIISTFSIKEARTISLLASSIKKIKNRSTINESMEMCTFFMEGLKRREPQLAADILPHIETFISSRAAVTTTDFLMEGFSEDGTLPYPEKEIQERWQDEKDRVALNEEFELFVSSRSTPAEGSSAPALTPTLENPSVEPALSYSRNAPEDPSAPAPELAPTPAPAPITPTFAQSSISQPPVPAPALERTSTSAPAAASDIRTASVPNNNRATQNFMTQTDTMEQFREYMRSLTQQPTTQHINKAA